MLTSRENLMRTLSGNGADRLVNQYDPFIPIMNDPIMCYVRGNRKKGCTTKDEWGTTFIWPEGQYAAMPHVSVNDKVLPDICKWRNYVNVPDIAANCTEWTDSIKSAAAIDREERMVMSFMGTGIFEQSHFLMGFEDTLINFLAYPESMQELLERISKYRMTYARLLVENLHPDAILSHDDWGSKMAMFMSPTIWRKFIKPLYAKLYGYMKSQGVLVIHHADSYLADIVEDMAEIGIDIWQGVLPQNDIPVIQKQLKGRMTLMGGIDSAIVDKAGSTEEVIRKEVRRACEAYAPNGYFIPCLTYGLKGSIFSHVDPIISDEIDKCSGMFF